MTSETRKLLTTAFAALGPAPSYEELELVLETLHASRDQDLEDALDAAGAAIWDGGDRQAVEELDDIAIEAGASGFTSLDLITA